jgi:hypothetical protein
MDGFCGIFGASLITVKSLENDESVSLYVRD